MNIRERTSMGSTLFWGIFRVVAVTILITLIAFAVSLFLSVVGVLLVSILRGGGIDMAAAYRNWAFPAAMVVLAITFAVTLWSEIRNFRRSA